MKFLPSLTREERSSISDKKNFDMEGNKILVSKAVMTTGVFDSFSMTLPMRFGI